MPLPKFSLVETAQFHTPESFVDTFKNPDAEVRAWINWELLLLSNPSIQEVVLYEKEEIGNLHTVWYHQMENKAVKWSHREANRILVKDVHEHAIFPSPRSADRISLFSELATEMTETDIITVPAYRTANGTFILLDGNHRSSAIYRSSQTVGLRVVSIGGIDDPFILPDLLHETGAALSQPDWEKACEEVVLSHKQYRLRAGLDAFKKNRPY